MLQFAVLVEVNEGIMLLSLALGKCNSTISTMLPTVTSNAQRMALWYTQALKDPEETGVARRDSDQ